MHMAAVGPIVGDKKCYSWVRVLACPVYVCILSNVVVTNHTLQKLQQVVKDLQEVDKLRHKVQDIQVPLEVFDYIDAGRNPQFYTKDCMEKALAKNEEERGKIDAYRMFKAKLLIELTSVFPKQMASYRAVRGDERVNP